MTIKIDDHLTLEPVDEKHARELFELVVKNRNYLKEWLPWVNNMQDIDFIEGFIRGSIKRNKDGSEYAFVIINEGKMVGRIGLYKIDGQNKIAEIGYWVAQDIQGKGIVTACCKSLINYGFYQL
jgi:ribosomal-protein-serine acetyltransferase